MMMKINHIAGSQKLRPDVVNTSNYLPNGILTSGCNEAGKAPHEVIMRKNTGLGNLKSFGCKAYVHIPKATRKSKLKLRAKGGLLVGYLSGDVYKTHLPNKERFTNSWDVTFEEENFGEQQGSAEVIGGKEDKCQGEQHRSVMQPSTIKDTTDSMAGKADNIIPKEDNSIGSTDSAEFKHAWTENQMEQLTNYPELRKSKRERNKTLQFSLDCTVLLIKQGILGKDGGDIPGSFEEAQSSADNNGCSEAT